MTEFPTPPIADICEVWWADTSQAVPALLDLLDGTERKRHAQYRLQADRDRYLVAHALARLVCARACGHPPSEVWFTHHCRRCDRPDPHGKPRPAGPASGLEISISHSGERIAVAATWIAEVGMDVERIEAGRDIDGLAGYVLSGVERTAFAAVPVEERLPGFFTYWTRKEALLKATGDGIAGGLEAVSVSAPGERAEVLAWKGPAAPDAVWLTDLDAGPDYRSALALLTTGPVEVVERPAADLW